jgi:hypothetical protein
MKNLKTCFYYLIGTNYGLGSSYAYKIVEITVFADTWLNSDSKLETYKYSIFTHEDVLSDDYAFDLNMLKRNNDVFYELEGDCNTERAGAYAKSKTQPL